MFLTDRTHGLVRFHQTGGFPILTWSCYRREPFLHSLDAKALFEKSLETMRVRYGFAVSGYVLMPGHIHLMGNLVRLDKHTLQTTPQTPPTPVFGLDNPLIPLP